MRCRNDFGVAEGPLRFLRLVALVAMDIELATVRKGRPRLSPYFTHNIDSRIVPTREHVFLHSANTTSNFSVSPMHLAAAHSIVNR